MSDSKAEMTATVGRIASRFRRGPDLRELIESWRYRLAGSADRMMTEARLLFKVMPSPAGGT